MIRNVRRSTTLGLMLGIGLSTLAASVNAQRGRAAAASGPGTVSAIDWSTDGKSVSYNNQGKRYRFDLKTQKKEEIGAATRSQAAGRRGRIGRRGQRGDPGANTGRYVGRPTRGRQYTRVDSPDGKWQAHYENWNVVLRNKADKKPTAVTIDGNEKIHYGTASWVYGEELNQTKAMWWTPNSKKLLYYRFDDSDVLPFHLVTG